MNISHENMVTHKNRMSTTNNDFSLFFYAGLVKVFTTVLKLSIYFDFRKTSLSSHFLTLPTIALKGKLKTDGKLIMTVSTNMQSLKHNW